MVKSKQNNRQLVGSKTIYGGQPFKLSWHEILFGRSIVLAKVVSNNEGSGFSYSCLHEWPDDGQNMVLVIAVLEYSTDMSRGSWVIRVV